MANDIPGWLEELGLGPYTQVFTESNIDFEVLPCLSDDNEPLARSDRRIATVDEEIGTRHERGLVAGQKQRTISNFFGPSQPVK